MIRKMILFGLLIIAVILGYLTGAKLIHNSLMSPMFIILGSSFTVLLKGLEEK